MTVDPAVLGKALASRLREIEAAIERFDAFAFTTDQPTAPPALAPGEATAAIRDLVLRALRTAADPVNYTVLRRLADGDTTLGALAEAAALPRLVLWERLSDLVVAGLVGRSLEGDLAGLTPAGHVVVGLVEDAARAGGEG